MTALDLFIEIVITVIEILLVFSTVTSACGRRYQGKRYFLTLAGIAGVMTVSVEVLNSIEAFSFFTLYYCAVFVAVASGLLSTASILCRTTWSVIAYFVISSFDYIISFTFGIFLGPFENISDIFYMLMAPGVPRIAFLFTVKGVESLVYLLTRKLLSRIGPLSNKKCLILAPTAFALYLLTNGLLSSILDDTYYPQLVAVLTWFFILVCVVLAIVVFVIISNYQTEKMNNQYLAQSNAMMMENYTEIHKRQQEYAKLVHDFKHHLLAIRGFLQDGKNEELREYVDSLLAVSYKEALLCRSGNDIIDAVINYKAKEAERDGIGFSFMANFSVPTNIAASDLCSLLANQIENALEACRKQPEDAERKIFVSVRQEDNFAVFCVENTVDFDPFTDNPELRTTKKDDMRPHGMGMRSIRDVVNKYDGAYRNEYRDGRFISMASLSFSRTESL